MLGYGRRRHHNCKIHPAHDLTIDSNLIYDIGWPDGGSPKCPSQPFNPTGLLLKLSVRTSSYQQHHLSRFRGMGNRSRGCDSGTERRSHYHLEQSRLSNSNGGIIITNGGDYSTVTNNIVLNNGVVAAQCGIHTIWAADNHILEANNDVYGNAGGDYCATGQPFSRTISASIQRPGTRSSTGRQMVQGIITRRQDRPPLTTVLPVQVPPRSTSTAIRVLKALPTISERTNPHTNGSMSQ